MICIKGVVFSRHLSNQIENNLHNQRHQWSNISNSIISDIVSIENIDTLKYFLKKTVNVFGTWYPLIVVIVRNRDLGLGQHSLGIFTWIVRLRAQASAQPRTGPGCIAPTRGCSSWPACPGVPSLAPPGSALTPVGITAQLLHTCPGCKREQKSARQAYRLRPKQFQERERSQEHVQEPVQEPVREPVRESRWDNRTDTLSPTSSNSRAGEKCTTQEDREDGMEIEAPKIVVPSTQTFN